MADDRSMAVGEESIAVLHPHWKTIAGPVALAAAVVALAVAGEALIPSGKDAAVERLVLAVVAIILVLWRLAYPILVWRTTVYELTTRRIRLRDGILTRNGRDIPLSRITDVSFRKGILDRFLDCGTLVVESAGEHGELALSEIPHVEQVFATLFQLVEDERRRDGRPRVGQADLDDPS
jgi:uncharacterized membrane protein YdbT with pleckstrin-like domain